MDDIAAKQAVRTLINTWTLRAGLQKQALAARAGFGSYDDFYRAYLDQSRALSTDPEAALRVVQALTTGLPEAERCTPEEAVAFFISTRLPLDRYPEVLQRGLFPPEIWRAALQQHLAIELPSVAPQPDPVTLLAAIDDLVRRASPATPGAPSATLHLDPTRPPPPPTTLPVPHRMPLAPARLFGGRDQELQNLVRLLRDQGVGEAVAITGIGGVGKTSLASELVHRYGQYFSGGVFWISCADPTAIERELAVCGATGLVQHPDWRDLTLSERAALVLEAWQAPVPRLLIFDNCEEDETLLRWRPTSGGCRVVLTSRRARWPRSLGVSELPLHELASADAVALLHRYRPDLASNDPHLAAIANELAGLPLALHLAGSYLETYQDDRRLGDPANFLRELQAQGPLEHTALQGEGAAPSLTRHEQHLGRTFALSIEQLDPATPGDALARTMLGAVGWLAPGEPFDGELLAAATSSAAGAARLAVRRLRDLGLLRSDVGLLRVHRLVADCAQATVSAAPQRTALVTALIARTEQAYLNQQPGEAPLLLPHMARLDASNREPAPDLLNSMPFLCELIGDLHSSRAYAQRAYDALATQAQLETPLGAEVIANLAEWQRLLGNRDAARPLYEEALAIRERILPPGDMALAESHNNLGELLRELGDYAASRYHYEQALALALATGGPEHNTTLAARNNLALLLSKLQFHREAAAQLRPLIATASALFGANDPRVATAQINLGTALAALGDLTEARETQRTAVVSLSDVLGERHPTTLLARLNAVEPLIMLGKRDAALVELRLLESLLSSAYGPQHPLTERARGRLEELGDGS
ncbi:tetratricopeptide repeat protein [Candidatus Chloroploca sp. M-50]|uniref:Tetratricopeptide repeat protein n=1 Tax=Candidatus Chloroploca mongolica TaxID=2528176 RepID=A0ABS4DDZ8_9CHLR|nr:tetratricopeptide repeat protein [Candidatus Chloroploca mongolica]MBP1467677.1 tetratricopeptide repeat protein [Candidatus Chloroploca mongolica]